VKFEYPIHFRYQNPGENLYEIASINRKPEFLLDCLNTKILNN